MELKRLLPAIMSASVGVALLACSQPGESARPVAPGAGGAAVVSEASAAAPAPDVTVALSQTDASDAGSAPVTAVAPQVPVGVTVGLRAPSFQANLLDGRSVSDADLRSGEKPYILYFFATW